MSSSFELWLSRRKFFTGLGSFGAFVALQPARAMLASQSSTAGLESRLAADPERPQFHLLPAKNWMNDPNAPVYHDGKYHMFFQYNPEAAKWGNMSWNHATSPDMLHWTHLPVALTPNPIGPDSYGVFSGSALQVDKRVYAVYTATRKSSAELATIKDGGPFIQESQCLAWSDDANLLKWKRDPKPVIPFPPEGMQITGFRDPSAWRQGSFYYMTVGSGTLKQGGCVLLYRSKDLKSWEYLHKLAEGKTTGKVTVNPCDNGEMWECPEFFALDGMHVLIYSTEGKVFWQSGRFDGETLQFARLKTGVLDLDAFYAPKTQLDAVGRRILWGWIPERRSEAAMLKAGWAGMMSLPRVMNLDKDGTLRLTILPSISSLRAAPVQPEQKSAETVLTLRGANGELRCRSGRQTAWTLTISEGPNELMKIQYSPATNTMVANGKTIPVLPQDEPSLHAFVDGSVLEVLLMERVGYTKRFYFDASVAPDLVVRVEGSDLKAEAWAVRPISGNRLTTPAVA